MFILRYGRFVHWFNIDIEEITPVDAVQLPG